MLLLGLSFAAPWLIGGLALAGLPILIHLLHRQRHQVMEWAAMKWLLAAMKKNQRRIQIQQWILLAVRTAIIALIVLAMMKPVLEQTQGLFSALAPNKHHIIVIDNSLSMQFGEGNLKRFERAKEMADAILDDARQGDFASVIVMTSPPTVLVGDASPYLVAVADEVDGITPWDGTARIEQITEPLAQICKASPVSRRQIYLITDMQRSTWLGEGDRADVNELKRRLVDLSEQAEFTILDTSGAASPNVAVTDIHQIDPVAIQGRPVVIRAGITNYSRNQENNVTVELHVDDQVEATQSVSLEAGESKFITFSPTLTRAGDTAIEIKAGSDSLSTDNSRFLIARVRESLRVLVIDGQPSGEPFKSETDYLRVALAPVREDGTPDFVHVGVKLESDLLEENLDRWDIVVLANVAQLTEAESKTISDFVRRGGGVIFFLGSQTNLNAFNRVLFAEGKGLLPVELLSLSEEPKPDSPGHTFDPKGYAHPLVADFRDHEEAGLVTSRIFRHVKAKLPEKSTAEVALAYDTGEPALVIANFGLGKVGVVTTSADLEWNTWAISPSYLPIMQQLVQILAAGRVRRDEVRVGDPIELSLPDGSADTTVSFTPPLLANAQGSPATPTSVKPALEKGISRAIFTDTNRSGIYRAQLGPPVNQTWDVAVNTWPVESDLSKLGDDELKGTFAGWKFRLLNQLESDEPIPAVSASAGSSLHRPILYAVLFLVLLEPVLAWWFGNRQAMAKA
ncbi:BatA domain-containing protein [bacterium]|nr:BatA domain-containing protein [bacterium]